MFYLSACKTLLKLGLRDFNAKHESLSCLVWPFPELISFPWVPGLGCDVHWNLPHIQSNVHCGETTSGVWSGCVYHTLEVGQSACLCLLVTPQAIKWMMFVLHQDTRALVICDGFHYTVSHWAKMRMVEISLKNAFICRQTIVVEFLYVLGSL